MHHSKITSAGRRAFLTKGAMLGATTLAAAAGGSRSALAQFAGAFGPIDRDAVTPGDIAILRFLAAAELVEDDLWQQYCELAVGHPAYNRALRRIDPSLIRYICDDRDDERSHAALINAFLVAIGEEPVNLDGFRTLPSVDAEGADTRGRLTSLTNLTVDTSWYLRYRSAENPDFGATFPQLVDIRNRPTVPVGQSRGAGIQAVAHSAAFHFAAIEQGGSSLYCSLIPRASSLDVLLILAAIGPTEVYHFSAFHKSLEGLFAWKTGDGLAFPDLRRMRTCPRPSSPSRRASCAATSPSARSSGRATRPTPGRWPRPGLAQSGLFEGQSQAFFDAVGALAAAATPPTHRAVTDDPSTETGTLTSHFTKEFSTCLLDHWHSRP